MSVVLFILASLALAAILHLTMKIVELTDAVDNNSAAVADLTLSVDKAIETLLSTGQPSTPDADIVPQIDRIAANTAALTNLKAKLEAALTPPQP